jgi:hypothetical protein
MIRPIPTPRPTLFLGVTEGVRSADMSGALKSAAGEDAAAAEVEEAEFSEVDIAGCGVSNVDE